MVFLFAIKVENSRAQKCVGYRLHEKEYHLFTPAKFKLSTIAKSSIVGHTSSNLNGGKSLEHFQQRVVYFIARMTLIGSSEHRRICTHIHRRGRGHGRAYSLLPPPSNKPISQIACLAVLQGRNSPQSPQFYSRRGSLSPLMIKLAHLSGL